MPLSAAKLRALRERAGLTQTDVAKAVGIARPNYVRMETGRNTNPKLNVAQAVARAIGCRVDDLLADDGPKPPKRRPGRG